MQRPRARDKHTRRCAREGRGLSRSADTTPGSLDHFVSCLRVCLTFCLYAHDASPYCHAHHPATRHGLALVSSCVLRAFASDFPPPARPVVAVRARRRGRARVACTRSRRRDTPRRDTPSIAPRAPPRMGSPFAREASMSALGFDARVRARASERADLRDARGGHEGLGGMTRRELGPAKVAYPSAFESAAAPCSIRAMFALISADRRCTRGLVALAYRGRRAARRLRAARSRCRRSTRPTPAATARAGYLCRAKATNGARREPYRGAPRPRRGSWTTARRRTSTSPPRTLRRIVRRPARARDSPIPPASVRVRPSRTRPWRARPRRGTRRDGARGLPKRRALLPGVADPTSARRCLILAQAHAQLEALDRVLEAG